MKHEWSIWYVGNANYNDPWPKRPCRNGEQMRNCIGHCSAVEYRHPVRVTASGTEWSDGSVTSK